MKKQYVYITKEDGKLIPHFVVSENRKTVQKKYGVCIDNIYYYYLLRRVKSWFKKVYNKDLIIRESFGIYIKDFYNGVEYIETFSQFRVIVNDYRNRD